MPIYEYRCDKGHTFEVRQRMAEDPLANCPTCKAPVQRVFHPVAIHFKGSGFYATDYGKKKSSGAKESKADSGSSDSGSSDSDSSKSDSSSNSGSSSSDKSKAPAKSDSGSG